VNPWLEVSPLIDHRHPALRARARALAGADALATARRCFHWVRDEIGHSCDIGAEPITRSAAEVLSVGHGFCYAKSHLLVALLRANGLPAALAYQRLVDADSPSGFCLHGLAAVQLPEIGWYRCDARGNRPGLEAHFQPPRPCLVWPADQPGEANDPRLYAEPLPLVVDALNRYQRVADLRLRLPDQCPLRGIPLGRT